MFIALDPNVPMQSSLWTTLLTCDIVLVLTLPRTKGDLARLINKPNVICFNSSTDSAAAPDTPINRVLSPFTSTPSFSISQSMPLDATQAIHANSVLRSSRPYSGSAQQKTQDFASLILQSGIPQLREVLESLSAPPQTQKYGKNSTGAYANANVLHLLTSSYVANTFLLSLSSAIAESRSFLHTASAVLGQIDLRSARDKRHSQTELGFTDLGCVDLEALVTDNPNKSNHAIITNKAGDAVAELASLRSEREVVLLEDGKQSIERALEGRGNRLDWWKMPFGRADDVATELGNALMGYFMGLERKVC